jgi:hypothetical protein
MTSGRTEDAFFKSELKRKVDSILDLRRARGDYFSPDLFGEPGWDMLLELYRTGDEDLNAPDIKQLSETLSLGQQVVSRWYDVLRNLGLVTPTAKGNLCLAAQARAAMELLIGQIVDNP